MHTNEQTATARPIPTVVSLMAKTIFLLSRWLSYVSMAATGAMMLVIAADVFMRRAFNSPIFGAYDVIKILLVIIVFCAVAYVMMVKEHVIVDSLTRLYPRTLKRVVIPIVQFLNMIILAVICWQSVNYGISMLRVGEKLVLLRIPIAPFILIVAFGYAIFFLVVLTQFIFTIFGGGEDTRQPVSSVGGNNG